MKELYKRNYLYISPSEQDQLRVSKIILSGCGIGSNIAECAMRLGFEHITLIDGDKVDVTNLNRQNYLYKDVGISKPTALKKRLLTINPKATIKTANIFLNSLNIKKYLQGHNIAINAMDYQSDAPFVFDETCQENGIPVLHPYNIGWATAIFIIMPGGSNLQTISKDYEGFEKKVASFLLERLNIRSKAWVKKVLQDYEDQGQGQSPPQLSIASWLAAGACTNLMYRLATGRPVKQFPDYYFVTIDDN